MKIETTAGDLLKALRPAGAVIERNSKIPVLTRACLSASTDNGIMLAVTNMDIFATFRMEGEVLEDGALLMHVPRIAGIVGTAPSAARIIIQTAGDGAAMSITVESPDMEFTWKDTTEIPVSEFPARPDLVDGYAWDIETGDLRSLLQRTYWAASREEARYYLNGIFLHLDDAGGMVAVATDGHRLAKYRKELKGTFQPAKFTSALSGESGIIMPRSVIPHILNSLPGDGSNDAVRVHVMSTGGQARPGWIGISIGQSDVNIYARLVDGTFPDYKRVIPDHTAVNMEGMQVDRHRLSRILRAFAGMAEGDPAVRFELDGACLGLKFHSLEYGDAHGRVPIAYTGKPVAVGLNGRYCTELLSQFINDAVTFYIDASAASGDSMTYHTPVVVREAGDDSDFLAVQMPMRI